MSEQVKALGLALGTNAPDKWDGKPPLATCTGCDAPLISTLLWRGYEFVCIECGSLRGFVEPRPARDTVKLRRRYEKLLAEWKAAELDDPEAAHAWIEARIETRAD